MGISISLPGLDLTLVLGSSNFKGKNQDKKIKLRDALMQEVTSALFLRAFLSSLPIAFHRCCLQRPAESN